MEDGGGLQFKNKNLLGWLTGSICWLERRLQVKASFPCMQLYLTSWRITLTEHFYLNWTNTSFMIWSKKHNGKTLGKETWPSRKGRKKFKIFHNLGNLFCRKKSHCHDSWLHFQYCHIEHYRNNNILMETKRSPYAAAPQNDHEALGWFDLWCLSWPEIPATIYEQTHRLEVFQLLRPAI